MTFTCQDSAFEARTRLASEGESRTFLRDCSGGIGNAKYNEACRYERDAHIICVVSRTSYA
jgi:hypothetical protein